MVGWLVGSRAYNRLSPVANHITRATPGLWTLGAVRVLVVPVGWLVGLLVGWFARVSTVGRSTVR